MKIITLPFSLLFAALTITSYASSSPLLRPIGCAIEDSFRFDRTIDEAPILVKCVPPEFPAELAKDNVTGEVKLRFIVGIDSRPTDIEVESQSKPEFGESAKRALAKARFKPAMKNGRPSPVRGSMTFLFVFRSDIDDENTE